MLYIHWISIVLAITLSNAQAAEINDADSAQPTKKAAFSEVVGVPSHAPADDQEEKDRHEWEQIDGMNYWIGDFSEHRKQYSKYIEMAISAAERGNKYVRKNFIDDFYDKIISLRPIKSNDDNPLDLDDDHYNLEDFHERIMTCITQTAKEENNGTAQSILAIIYKDGLFGKKPDLDQYTHWAILSKQSARDTNICSDAVNTFRGAVQVCKWDSDTDQAIDFMIKVVKSYGLHPHPKDLLALANLYNSRNNQTDSEKVFSICCKIIKDKNGMLAPYGRRDDVFSRAQEFIIQLIVKGKVPAVPFENLFQ